MIHETHPEARAGGVPPPCAARAPEQYAQDHVSQAFAESAKIRRGYRVGLPPIASRVLPGLFAHTAYIS